MTDLKEGESTEVKGSAAKPYVIKNIDGVYSCRCPAWRNQSKAIDLRSCKHIQNLRGLEAEKMRVGDLSKPTKRSRQAAQNNADQPPILLAERWENSIDLKCWWMSEKLDGVRAYWDGKQFLSRTGKQYKAPAWFMDGLPTVPLDGELWIDRQQFQKTVSIVRRAKANQEWQRIKYVVFDAPAHAGTFEQRLEFLTNYFAENQLSNTMLLAQQPCNGIEHMQEELERVLALGGEGLMMREPGSSYEQGRSSTLLKVKRFFDAEAKVLGHAPGRGKHKGRLGALQVIMPNGVEFSVGTGFSDAERQQPPAIGSIITYRYQELSTAGVPRFPSYVAIRYDYVWPASGQPEAIRDAGVNPINPPDASTMKGDVAFSSYRYFEFEAGGSHKFWKISVNANQHQVCYGKVGSKGVTKTKQFADEQAAEGNMAKLVVAKIKKGYIEKN